MKLAKDDLIAALRLRYDYYSAQTVFDVARERAGLADQASYELPHVVAFRSALEAVGDRVDKVQERLEALLGGSGSVTVAAPAAPPAAPPASAAPLAEASTKDSEKNVAKDAAKDKDGGKDKDIAKDKDGGKDKDVAKDKDGGKDKAKRATDAKSDK